MKVHFVKKYLIFLNMLMRLNLKPFVISTYTIVGEGGDKSDLSIFFERGRL